MKQRLYVEIVLDGARVMGLLLSKIVRTPSKEAISAGCVSMCLMSPFLFFERHAKVVARNA